MNHKRNPDAESPPKWLKGRGLGPHVKWHVKTDGELSSLAYARETGNLVISDSSGTLTQFDRHGQITTINHLHDPLRRLTWSDDGRFGAALAGEELIYRFDYKLRVIDQITPPDIPIALCISPFGHHMAVSLANGSTVFYNERGRKIARFETLRPLAFLKFCPNEPIVFGAAEHGLVCCHNLAGAEIWQEKNWTNVGGLRTTGDGDLIYLASFAHGIEAYDGDGAAIGSYILDGTVNRIDTSYEPHRLIATTVEGSLFWLDADGELLWSTTLPEEVVDIVCDPFGEWAMIGLVNESVYRLDWASED